MLNMESFYKLLSNPSKIQGSYLEALRGLTKAGPAELDPLKSDLAWQYWNAQTPKAAEA